MNQLRAIGDAGGGATRFTYDPNGNLLTVTDARGNSTSYADNTMDRLTTGVLPVSTADPGDARCNGRFCGRASVEGRRVTSIGFKRETPSGSD